MNGVPLPQKARRESNILLFDKAYFIVIVGRDPTIHEKVNVSTFRKKHIDSYVVDSGSWAGMTTNDWLFS